MGAAAVEGSARWWSRDHRAHHKYVDTEKDPYAATKGFFFAHCGWMFSKQDPSKIGRADISGAGQDGEWGRWASSLPQRALAARRAQTSTLTRGFAGR